MRRQDRSAAEVEQIFPADVPCGDRDDIPADSNGPLEVAEELVGRLGDDATVDAELPGSYDIVAGDRVAIGEAGVRVDTEVEGAPARVDLPVGCKRGEEAERQGIDRQQSLVDHAVDQTCLLDVLVAAVGAEGQRELLDADVELPPFQSSGVGDVDELLRGNRSALPPLTFGNPLEPLPSHQRRDRSIGAWRNRIEIPCCCRRGRSGHYVHDRADCENQ